MLKKFIGKADEIKIVMKHDSHFVRRPVRLYAGDMKNNVKIEWIAKDLAWTGEDLKIGVDNKTFYDSVRHAPESELTIAFWDPQATFIIKSKNEDYEVHLQS